jgi:hypothetical protein
MRALCGRRQWGGGGGGSDADQGAGQDANSKSDAAPSPTPEESPGPTSDTTLDSSATITGTGRWRRAAATPAPSPSRLLAAKVNSAAETPAFAESLGRISRQRRCDTMKHWGNSRSQSQQSPVERWLGLSD